jgi:uncharacterized protein (DUF924 family)
MKYEQLKLGEVLRFWFEELTHEQRFAGDAEVDAMIVDRFTDIHAQVAAGEFWRYRTEANSYLAEIIVLDQFSRQLFRDSGQAFAYDGMSLTLAQQAVATGLDQQLDPAERMFIYMPFMHSESKLIHKQAVPLFESLGMEEALKYEHIHKDIIDQFGRYPHRNERLGREMTAAEKEYLASNQESFF